MWVYGQDWAGPGQRQMADACECGNEPSGSVKCGEFLDQLEKHLASQEGLCTMEQVSIVSIFKEVFVEKYITQNIKII